MIDVSLEFTVKSYGWLLPDIHEVYKQNKRSTRNTTISLLLISLQNLSLCNGVQHYLKHSKIITHSITEKFRDPNDDESPNQSRQYHRSNECTLLLANELVCLECKSLEVELSKQANKKLVNTSTPAHKFAPLQQTNPKKVSKALIEERRKKVITA